MQTFRISNLDSFLEMHFFLPSLAHRNVCFAGRRGVCKEKFSPAWIRYSVAISRRSLLRFSSPSITDIKAKGKGKSIPSCYNCKNLTADFFFPCPASLQQQQRSKENLARISPPQHLEGPRRSPLYPLSALQPPATSLISVPKVQLPREPHGLKPRKVKRNVTGLISEQGRELSWG